jgi:serine/threonine protein kinase
MVCRQICFPLEPYSIRCYLVNIRSSLIPLKILFKTLRKVDKPKYLDSPPISRADNLVSNVAKDLLIKMLKYNPDDRITWEDLYVHPIFDPSLNSSFEGKTILYFSYEYELTHCPVS